MPVDSGLFGRSAAPKPIRLDNAGPSDEAKGGPFHGSW
jgi:hypothetical protein